MTKYKVIYRSGTVKVYDTGSRFRVAWFKGRQFEKVFRDESDAIEYAGEIAAGIRSGSVTGPDALFGALVTRGLDPAGHPKWGDNHLESMRSTARNHVIPVLGTLRCADVTRQAVGKLFKDIAAAGYSSSTLSKVRKVIRYAVNEGLILGIYNEATDPLRGLSMPAATGKAQVLETISPAELPTDAEVEALIVEMDKHGDMYGLMARLAAFTGVRWGELLALTPADFDLKNRDLRIYRQVRETKSGFELAPPKTRAGVRCINIERSLVPQIRGYIASHNLRDSDFLFTTRTGTHISRSNWNCKASFGEGWTRPESKFRQAKKAAGWSSNLSWHSLRHYCATRWLRLGTDLPDVTELIGHENTYITQTLYIGKDRNAAQRMKKLL
jgi:integrase